MKDSINHVGVLGMKWGRRKGRASSGSNTSGKSSPNASGKSSPNGTAKYKSVVSNNRSRKMKSFSKTLIKIGQGAVRASIRPIIGLAIGYAVAKVMQNMLAPDRGPIGSWRTGVVYPKTRS